MFTKTLQGFHRAKGRADIFAVQAFKLGFLSDVCGAIFLGWLYLIYIIPLYWAKYSFLPPPIRTRVIGTSVLIGENEGSVKEDNIYMRVSWIKRFVVCYSGKLLLLYCHLVELVFLSVVSVLSIVSDLPLLFFVHFWQRRKQPFHV